MRISSGDARGIATAALAEVGGTFEVDRLTRFVASVAAHSDRAVALPERELHSCRDDGAWAARAGVDLPELVDAYLSAVRLLWERLMAGDRRTTEPVATGAWMFSTVDAALAQVAAGFAEARRRLVREDEVRRQEFADDLLRGAGATTALLDRAEQYGLSVAAPHCVLVLGSSDPGADPLLVAGDVEAAARRRSRHGVLVVPRHGRLVVVLQCQARPGADRPVEADRIGRTLRAAAERLAGAAGRRAGVSASRVRAGAAGIAASYREADEGLDLVLAWDQPARVVHAAELAVFRVLLRDRESMIELVESVLGPLRGARGGVSPLLDTLHAYLASGAVSTETARRLHLSVRAVTYRLQRLQTLTGYDPGDVDQRFTLQVAAVGARLLRWPSETAALADRDSPPS